MSLSDPIGALVRALTGRSLDLHALDTVPAAAQMPGTVELVRRCRVELILTIDDLHQWFSSQADAYPGDNPAAALAPMVQSLTQFAALYLQSRAQLDTLVGKLAHRDPENQAPQPVRRRYIRAGTEVEVTLPATQTCQTHCIAGHTMRVSVTDVDAETHLRIGPDKLRLAHHDAGIYRDPATGRLYTLERTAI